MPFPFDNSYARLPENFYSRLAPTPVAAPRLIKLNAPLAKQLGLDLDALSEQDAAEIFAGNRVPEGADPIAMAYGGHQFGHWSGPLGDGRAILLGEVVDADGQRRDIHLKGAGRTPYSRNGDGRSWLGPVIREYLVSEAMAALRIPTTRALAAVTTGEDVMREGALPGGVITRVAASHVRVGTFEFFAADGNTDALKTLADHVIGRHYPEITGSRYLGLLDKVVAAQADLIAKWMGVGFIHGVMNTDNMAISGETIDYGPCAFMDTYHPGTVFSSIDHQGRYAYQNQPPIGQWNLSSLASTLMPLIDDDADTASQLVTESVESFQSLFMDRWRDVFRRKLGLHTPFDGDEHLAHGLLDVMAAHEADFTLTFRRLSALDLEPGGEADYELHALFNDGGGAVAQWLAKWRARLKIEKQSDAERQAAMRAANPAYIPRNHRVEAAIQAAVAGDFEPFEKLNAILARPFDDQPDNADYQTPPEAHEVVRETFCGT